MKKIILILIALIVLIGVLYSYFGGFPLGYKNGHFVILKYTCIDLCPQYGRWSVKYFGKIDEKECFDIGGQPSYITAAGVVEHGYNGCSPK